MSNPITGPTPDDVRRRSAPERRAPVIRASLVTVSVSLLLALTALVNTSVTARVLGPEGRGLLASSLLAVALARGLALLGLGEAFVFRARQGQLALNGRRHLLRALGVVLIAGSTISAAIVSLGPLKAAATAGLLTIAFAGVGSIFDLLVASARFERELWIFNWLRFLGPCLATLILVVAWALMPLSVDAVISIQLWATLLAAILGYWAIRRLLIASLPVRSDARMLTNREFLRSGFAYQGVAILGLLLTHAHMYIVMSVGSLSSFGIYSAAFGLSRMVAPIQMAIGSALFASSAGSDPSAGGTVALRAFRLTFLPLLCLAGALSAVSPWLIRWLLGPDFDDAALPFALLLFEAVIGGAGFMLGQHLQALGRVRPILVRNAVSVLPLALGALTLRGSEVSVQMAFLMLIASAMRLSATLLVFRKGSAASPWRLYPSAGDLELLRNVTKGRR